LHEIGGVGSSALALIASFASIVNRAIITLAGMALSVSNGEQDDSEENANSY